MIMEWLLTQKLGMTRGGWLLIAIGILAITIFWIVSAEKADDKANQTVGATTQREADLRETVNRVEEANAAREEIRGVDRDAMCARYAQCVRSARTPENCVRFLPDSSTGIGCPGPVASSGRPGE